MLRYGFVAATVALALAVSACSARSQVHVGVGMDRDGLRHFELALGDMYGMPVGPIPSYIYPDELPVIYLLAREARVSPEVVMSLREQGWSWIDITYHLGIDPYLYVHRLPRQTGYWGYRGRTFGYLTDRHIIDYVNLFFWADYHRRPVTQLIVIRQRVPTWTYYVHYHAPRVVYVGSSRRYSPPPARRGDTGRAVPGETRRAQPRDATPRAVPRTTSPTVRTTEQATRPTPQASRPTQQATRPTPQASRPTRQATRPTTQARPTTQSRPAAQSSRPTQSRPAAQSSRPTQSRPAATSRPNTSRPRGN